jgi:DNA-binding SARP family transcriptional activator
LDVAEFEEAFATTKDVRGRDLDLEKAHLLESAAQLYHGDLLEGWYEDWCLFERERLQNMYLAILDKLMGYCEVNKQYETGILYGTRILFFDRAHEQTHQHLMRLQYLAGNRTAALRQYERCSAALDEELGVKPAKFTLALYQQIRNDEVDELPISTATKTRHVPKSSPVPAQELLARLNQVNELLTDVQKAVRGGMQAIELVMKDHR